MDEADSAAASAVVAAEVSAHFDCRPEVWAPVAEAAAAVAEAGPKPVLGAAAGLAVWSGPEVRGARCPKSFLVPCDRVAACARWQCGLCPK